MGEDIVDENIGDPTPPPETQGANHPLDQVLHEAAGNHSFDEFDRGWVAYWSYCRPLGWLWARCRRVRFPFTDLDRIWTTTGLHDYQDIAQPSLRNGN